MGLDHPKHTLHAALSKRGLSDREGLDLHQALQRRRGERIRGDDDGDDNNDNDNDNDNEGKRPNQKYIRKLVRKSCGGRGDGGRGEVETSKELRGEDDWDDSSRTAPVGQSIQVSRSCCAKGVTVGADVLLQGQPRLDERGWSMGSWSMSGQTEWSEQGLRSPVYTTSLAPPAPVR
eukprot:753151-Hanusia_phi.AAC.2